MKTKYQLEPIANYHCHTGENPLWDEQKQIVYWTDIPNGRLFKYEAQTGKHRQIYTGEPVGGFTLQTEGSLLLFQVNKFSLLLPNGKTRVLADNIDPEMTRFNDVIADPEGRVFAGTIGKNNKGGLYRIDTNGDITNLFKGTGCSNGMGFSPDLHHFYWTCSSTRRIFRFKYHRNTGQLTDRKVLIAVGENEGVPDGLTIDTAGNIWSARWDGYALYKYSPDGKPIDKIEFPVAKVSSVIFGGANLDELYVTTAGGSQNADTPDGTLYRVKVPNKGRLEFRSKIHTG
ncbi:MAG: SMP-30/gluconolactonase/LRE family protein [Planctomycetota bacterium]|nr:MAG: SMP-30/gluconolactonase/LRE family protein [Planctomycetota bacterium]